VPEMLKIDGKGKIPMLEVPMLEVPKKYRKYSST
jgi:hypothetical protein